ncbi:MAG: very short patch repair endonuclease [Actinomycetes bacterium]|jgi:DNA mismatch endonuclease (patch repair protein)|nr:very short patch repair endonuclease [Actinomycetes bacterium]
MDDSRKVNHEGIRKSMRSNRSRDTGPELLVRHALRSGGYPGYRLQWNVPGRPDIAYPGRKIAVFVNGCFWHRCPYCNPSFPATNIAFWEKKFADNAARDRRALKALREMGWATHVIWECQLKPPDLQQTIRDLLNFVAAYST